MSTEVVIVDDDEITRVGTTTILDSHADIHVVTALTHIDAVEAMGTWAGIDIVIVDAADQRRSDDQFPGVAIVQAIRVHRRPEQTRIIVVTGIVFDDAIRRRMREAGADYYFHRSALPDAASLWAAVMQPTPTDGVPLPSDPEALHRLGVSDRTQVNAAIAAGAEEGFLNGDPLLAQRSRDRTRRRDRFNQTARLNSMTAQGVTPDRKQEAPSLPQIERFLRWATRIRHGDEV